MSGPVRWRHRQPNTVCTSPCPHFSLFHYLRASAAHILCLHFTAWGGRSRHNGAMPNARGVAISRATRQATRPRSRKRHVGGCMWQMYLYIMEPGCAEGPLTHEGTLPGASGRGGRILRPALRLDSNRLGARGPDDRHNSPATRVLRGMWWRTAARCGWWEERERVEGRG